MRARQVGCVSEGANRHAEYRSAEHKGAPHPVAFEKNSINDSSASCNPFRGRASKMQARTFIIGHKIGLLA
jgi:hypothetical protein